MAASPKHLVLPPSFASSYTDKYAHGPYSYAPPGRVPLRAALAEPVSNRPFFAGEATSTDLHRR